jgi:hypothetical protein
MDESLIREYAKAYRQIFNLSGISLIFGIISVVFFIAVVLFRGDPPEDFVIVDAAVIAVAAGSMALFKLHKYPKLMSKVMAITGVACGGSMLLLILSFIIVVLAT